MAMASVLSAQVTVFVTRHADRDASEPDAALTELGLRQAETLSEVLRSAGIKHIYTTEFIRTQQTAAPLARISKAPVETVKQADLHELVARVLRNTSAGDAILVVGHRGTVPQIVKALSGKAIEPLGSFEYGRLLAVTLFADGRSSVVTLRYWPFDEPEHESKKGEAN
jgi:broad specificity phosphatase PhoE